MSDKEPVTDTRELLALASEGFRSVHDLPELQARALDNLRFWLEVPALADAVPQISALIEAGNFNALFDAFFRQIPFGTGGRRGPVGFGANRINAFTISTSIQGHARFLRERFPRVDRLSVVVAYDVRVFNDLRGVYDRDRPNPLIGMTSKDFGRIAASVYAANGIKVWMPDPGEDTYISTPELSFAIRYLKAQGGLNVSASHNHPDDNGAKIYNHRGSQEVPPVDEELAKIVEATHRAESMPFEAAVEERLVEWLPDRCYRAYLEANAGVSRDPGARSARVIFTPLHGTGFHSAGAVLEAAKFDVLQYPDQARCDGMFTSVPFRSPNPEVRESLQGATEYAKRAGGDLVLGTDPDADRIGMVAPHAGEWVFFTGNEIGLILAQYLLSGASVRKRAFAVTTVVTTSLFAKICRSHGVQVVDDLGVGFKYIAEIINAIEATGKFDGISGSIDDFLIGIEESHGFLVIPDVRDKDAAGAAVLLAEIASRLKDEGRSFVDYLDDIYRRHGYVRNSLVSTVMQGATGFQNMRRIQDGLRAERPAEIGGRKVLEFVDRWDESGPLGRFKSETDRASRDLLTFVLEGNARLTLRPSGTESKNKIYVEVRGEPLGARASASVLAAEKKRVDAASRQLAKDFTRVMLARIGVTLPDYALEISDLVPLECKQEFAASLLPDLLGRIARGDAVRVLVPWINERLRAYGADGRLLVRPAVLAYIESESPAAGTAARLRECFEA